MKKYFMSAVFVFLLIFVISSPAHAEGTYYPSPGDIEAGTELNHLIASVPSGSVILSSGSLPEGIALQWSDNGSETSVYLRGTAMKAGTYNCLININGKNDLLCTLHIIPSKPSVSISGDQNCAVGDSVSIQVSAEVRDGGSLSYSWYKNTLASASGGILVDSASGPVYSPDTSVPGVYYYYCEVKNTNNGEFSSVYSAVSTIEVGPSSVASVEIETLPLVTEYAPGEEFSAEGLSLLVKYNDGSSEIITEGFSISPVSLDSTGSYNVTVNYKGHSCSFEIIVSEDEGDIEGIGILSMPLKTVYIKGEELSAEGLSLRAYTASGHRNVISGFTCSPAVLENAGSQVIEVRYGGKLCTFTVEVFEEELPVSLDISAFPSKLNYRVGESLNTDGLVLKLNMNTGAVRKITEGFTCSPVSFDKSGNYEVVVSYADLSCRFSVSVEQVPVPEEPSPVAEITPSEPDVSPEPPVNEEPAEEAGGSALPVVIVSVVLVSIAALVVLVYSINKAGKSGAAETIGKLISKIRKK